MAKPQVNEDVCAVCTGSTRTEDAVAHWASPTSVDLIAFTCSDPCAACFEQARRAVDSL